MNDFKRYAESTIYNSKKYKGIYLFERNGQSSPNFEEYV